MSRVDARLEISGLSHEDALRLLSESCAASSAAKAIVDAHLSASEPTPEWAREAILLNVDLLPHVLAHCAFTDVAARAVCKTWQRAWDAGDHLRRGLWVANGDVELTNDLEARFNWLIRLPGGTKEPGAPAASHYHRQLAGSENGTLMFIGDYERNHVYVCWWPEPPLNNSFPSPDSDPIYVDALQPSFPGVGVDFHAIIHLCSGRNRDVFVLTRQNHDQVLHRFQVSPESPQLVEEDRAAQLQHEFSRGWIHLPPGIQGAEMVVGGDILFMVSSSRDAVHAFDAPRDFSCVNYKHTIGEQLFTPGTHNACGMAATDEQLFIGRTDGAILVCSLSGALQQELHGAWRSPWVIRYIDGRLYVIEEIALTMNNEQLNPEWEGDHSLPGGVECGRRIIVIDPKDGSVLQICDVGKEIPVGDVLLDIVMFGGFLFAVSRLSRLVALKGLWGRESEESARELCARVVV